MEIKPGGASDVERAEVDELTRLDMIDEVVSWDEWCRASVEELWTSWSGTHRFT